MNKVLKGYFDCEIDHITPVGGGCINEAVRVGLSDGREFFVKQNDLSRMDMFEKEATGLKLLEKASTPLRIPHVHALLEDQPESKALLVLSFIEEGRPRETFHRDFGKALASLHRYSGDFYGLDHDNYIGSLPQKNTPHDSWISFFISCRIEPQFSLARQNGYFDRSTTSSLNRLYSRLGDLMPDEPPSLLHGDLWGGNYLCDRNGRAVLVDPAVYYGNREAELAFTRMFGGFDPAFYQGYEEAWPLLPGFPKRKDLYNLYPLLVHVNLFGGGYVSQAESVIRRYQ